MVAMQRAIAGLSIQPDMALIDGNRVPELPMDGFGDSERGLASC